MEYKVIKRIREESSDGMGKIFYVMGKSASGKDTIYNRLAREEAFDFRNIVGYTTRPMRENEMDGREYHFVNDEELKRLEKQGRVIEKREYHTIHGVWCYFTVDDGSIDLKHENYLLIGTLESYQKLCDYFGSENLVPIYIEVEDSLRLTRAMEREKQQSQPKYTEMCRRFVADAEDFSEEKINAANIKRRYQNTEFDKCYNEIIMEIRQTIVK